MEKTSFIALKGIKKIYSLGEKTLEVLKGIDMPAGIGFPPGVV